MNTQLQITLTYTVCTLSNVNTQLHITDTKFLNCVFCLFPNILLTLQSAFSEYLLHHVVEAHNEYIEKVILFYHLTCQALCTEQLHTDMYYPVSHGLSVQGIHQYPGNSTVMLDKRPCKCFLE